MLSQYLMPMQCPFRRVMFRDLCILRLVGQQRINIISVHELNLVVSGSAEQLSILSNILLQKLIRSVS